MNSTPQTSSFGVAPKIRSVSLDGNDWLSRLSDRVNPLIIREIRQGLRTRVFWMSFGLMLAACLVTSIVAYGVHSDNPMTAHGQEFFTTYFVILGLVHFLILPFNAFRSLMKEREEETWVLLSLTGLGPRRILLGKAASTLVQGVLYASAILPFIVFSYFLNGIALPSILMVLGLGFAHHAFLTVMAVCLATLGDNKVFRAGAQLICVLMLFGMFTSAVSVAGIVANVGGSFGGKVELLATAAATLTNELILALVVLEAAAARLMLTTEDYARRPRKAWLLAIVTMAPITWAISNWAGNGVAMNVAMSGLAAGFLIIVGAVLIATDRDGCSPRFRSSSLFRPGALPGFRLAMLVLLALSVVLAGLGITSTRGLSAVLFGLASALLFVALYLSITALATRLVKVWDLRSPLAQRGFFVGAYLIGAGLPPLLSIVLDVRADTEWLNALNPLVGPFNIAELAEDTHVSDAVSLFVAPLVLTTLLALAANGVLWKREEDANAEMDGQLSEARAA